MPSANKHHRTRAFTLIELMVTIGIMSLLVAALGLGIRSAQVNSRDSKRVNDILSIGKAIDQYSLTNRGNYPGNTNPAGNKATMCAGDLLNAANSNELDLNLLPSKSIPTDPRAVTPPTGGVCTSYLNGYTYHTEFGQVGTSLATKKKATYALEVGLEGKTPSDVTTLQTDGASSNGRTRYVLYGSFCGSNCYK